jgi:hypothetical protein
MGEFRSSSAVLNLYTKLRLLKDERDGTDGVYETLLENINWLQ